ncbi:MAG: N-acetyl sugar amidotransferase [Bacteroidia bacterium]|nr:N-acetyl sugar amidotransferase [Bacteroidia bacterium]
MNQICARCLMDTSEPDIRFDSNGYCNHCTNYLALYRQVQEAAADPNTIDSFFNYIRSRGKKSPYDCIVALSGGTDSCYVALLCKKYGLRTLLVHFDNGWNTPIAENNIQKVIEYTGFDFFRYRIEEEMFKKLQIAFLKASVPDVELPTDAAIPGALYEVAEKNKVRSILLGCNYHVEGILPWSWQYDARDVRYLKGVYHTYYANRDLKNFPYKSVFKEIQLVLFKGIKMYYPLNYTAYDRSEAAAQLEQIGWQRYGGVHHESAYTKIVQSYILPVKFGIDYRRIHLSIKVLQGKLSRDEALALLRKSPYEDKENEILIEEVCKRFGLTRREFDELMKLPPKTYKDYPNSAALLSLIHRLRRLAKAMARVFFRDKIASVGD